MKNILVTGASGLVGTRLVELLLESGYTVSSLTRGGVAKPGVRSFLWNPEKNELDPSALQNIDAIIHLAGENVGQERWTKKRKEKILSSRIGPTSLLYEALLTVQKRPESFICASAIGIYGRDSGLSLQSENSPKGKGFLADVTEQWEQEADRITSLGIRLVKLRIGIVLSSEAGALAKMSVPVNLGIGSPLGKGNQGMSWIHIDDLCRLFIFSIEHSAIRGAYNAVSPYPVSNTIFTSTLAKVLKKPFFVPNIPSFVLYLVLGEMADIVVGGNYVDSKKIQSCGFDFQYQEISLALKELCVKR